MQGVLTLSRLVTYEADNDHGATSALRFEAKIDLSATAEFRQAGERAFWHIEPAAGECGIPPGPENYDSTRTRALGSLVVTGKGVTLGARANVYQAAACVVNLSDGVDETIWVQSVSRHTSGLAPHRGCRSGTAGLLQWVVGQLRQSQHDRGDHRCWSAQLCRRQP